MAVTKKTLSDKTPATKTIKTKSEKIDIAAPAAPSKMKPTMMRF